MIFSTSACNNGNLTATMSCSSQISIQLTIIPLTKTNKQEKYFRKYLKCYMFILSHKLFFPLVVCKEVEVYFYFFYLKIKLP